MVSRALASIALGLLFLAQPIGPVRVAAATDAATEGAEAPTGFDGGSNGAVPESMHGDDRDAFEEVNDEGEGLGPVFNETACANCHSVPISGGSSTVAELRVGHVTDGVFVNPIIGLGNNQFITGRSLVNSMVLPTCSDIHQSIPETENVRTKRLSTTLLGTAFVEAVPDETLLAISKLQCATQDKTGICGQAMMVPLLEAPDQKRVGRFGWKDQHASLLSFAADAYINENGITSTLQPVEPTTVCDTVAEPEDDDENDVPKFASFMRASKAPARDALKASSAAGRRGYQTFAEVGCAACHVPALVTAAPGTAINGGTFEIPQGVGSRVFHPFSDFLLHDIGTGDGIAMSVDDPASQASRNKIRSAPLWGARFRESTGLLHDGRATSFSDAIAAHAGEATRVRQKFDALKNPRKDDVIQFLRSL